MALFVPAGQQIVDPQGHPTQVMAIWMQQVQFTLVQIQLVLQTQGSLAGAAFAVAGSGDGSGDGGGDIPGPPGIPGVTGATGAPGPAGIAAIDGSDGEDAWTIPGPQGPTGNPGATGPAGAIGIGLDGDQGEDAFPIPGPVGPSGATGSAGVSVPPQGRITLTSGVPFLSTTVTAATTIYYTPAVGNWVPLYSGGSTWTPTVFTELSQATTDATKSPAAVAANNNYDLFVWDDSGTLRCTRGPAWSSDTSRGTGAGTSELEYVSGILLNKHAITNGPSADRGTYVGTVRSNGSAQIDLIFGGTGAVGGESTVLGIWNMYVRCPAALANYDTTDSWNYTLATWRIKNGNNANKIAFVIGWLGDGLEALNGVWGSNTTTNVFQATGIGLDSTTAFALNSSTFAGRSVVSGATFGLLAAYRAMAPLGYHYVAPLEISTASGTSTWYGDNGGGNANSCFSALIPF